MIIFAEIIVAIWIIFGVAALFWGCRNMHDPKNKELLDGQIKELSSDLNLPEKDCMGILYVSFLLFGFLAVPIVLIRRVVKAWKAGKADGSGK